MTVRVYRWDDSGAPTLTGQAGSLITLLDAVLVNGYGSKVAAGWTKSYAGTNVAGYTNARAVTPQGIKVSHTNAAYATVVGYESIAGDGTPTNSFPTTAQLANGLYWYLSSTSDTTQRPWLIVADSLRFYLWIGASVTTATGLQTTTYQQTYFAGDIISYRGGDAYSFMVLGGISVSLAACPFGTLVSAFTSTTTGHYIARSHTQAGTSIPIYKTGDPVCEDQTVMGTGGTGTPAYPDPVSGGMLLSRVRLFSISSMRGHLPGVWTPLHNLPGNPGDTFSGTGTLGGRTFLLLDSCHNGSRARIAIETSDTWD